MTGPFFVTPLPHGRTRAARSAVIALAALLCAAGAASAQMPSSQERDFAREAVTNLEAYAVYKMGRYDEARQIWEGLAAKGNATAMINLANMFQQGQGVTEDQKKAMELIARAAEHGDSRAQYELGMAYEKGQVLERDIEKAAHWLRKSAEQDDADGQFAYGVMLASGIGKGLDKATPEQRAEAIDWLRKAKKNGNLEAGDYIAVLEARG